ncbi:MAG: type II secretion system protein [Patescibacteria group bacterium]
MTKNPQFRNSVILKFSNSLAGFTLIEALAVISIIGILASLSMYAFTSATSRGRDARRKSDLTAISLGFQARFEAKTCSSSAEMGRYPGYDVLDGDHWKPVSDLRGTSDGCGAFSEYLITIPTNPNDSDGPFTYLFDLSTESGVIDGKHYRLTAKLEKTLNENELMDLARAKTIWHDSFEGNLTQLPADYNYIIGN